MMSESEASLDSLHPVDLPLLPRERAPLEALWKHTIPALRYNITPSHCSRRGNGNQASSSRLAALGLSDT